jgi:hypothetical protein
MRKGRIQPGLEFFVTHRLPRRLSIAALCLSLAACAGGTPFLSSRGASGSVGNLDGTYRGEMTGRTGRAAACVLKVSLVVTLKLGEARADMFNSISADSPSGSFYGYVEPNGRLRTTARVGDQTLAIDADFSGERFSGYAENDKCSMTISARRENAG